MIGFVAFALFLPDLVSSRSHGIQLCRGVCAKTERCMLFQHDIVTMTCHRVNHDREDNTRTSSLYKRTPETGPEMKCKACKSVKSLQSQPRRNMHKNKDKKTGAVSHTKQHVPPSRRVYRKLTAGETTFYVERYPVRKTWEEALKQCRSDGGTLLDIDSRIKTELLLKKYAFMLSHWIGLKDLYDNDTFFWTDGSPLTYSRWGNDQPSHQDLEGKKENCVGLSMAITKGYCWYDEPCDKLYAFFCER